MPDKERFSIMYTEDVLITVWIFGGDNRWGDIRENRNRRALDSSSGEE